MNEVSKKQKGGKLKIYVYEQNNEYDNGWQSRYSINGKKVSETKFFKRSKYMEKEYSFIKTERQTGKR